MLVREKKIENLASARFLSKRYSDCKYDNDEYPGNLNDKNIIEKYKYETKINRILNIKYNLYIMLIIVVIYYTELNTCTL